MPLSAVIISFNEEKNIARCLTSLQGVVDEIIVVDSYSTDNTVALAQSLGALVFQHPFEGHIQQKNYALSKASNDWILSLDSDEALDKELQESIRSISKQTISNGYLMNRLTQYCGTWIRHCGWYPDKKLRLFNRTMGQWGGQNPHDRFILYEDYQNLKTLKGNILHYSYYTVDEHFKQMDYFAGIAARAMLEQSKKPKFFKQIINPIWKFLRMYFLQLGFLDGWRGFQVCSISAYGTFLKYHRHWTWRHQVPTVFK